MAGHKKKKRTYLDLRDKRYKNCANNKKRKAARYFKAKENREYLK